MENQIEFYNQLSLTERLLFAKVCRLERKCKRARRKLRNKIEGLEELVEEVESTKE